MIEKFDEFKKYNLIKEMDGRGLRDEILSIPSIKKAFDEYFEEHGDALGFEFEYKGKKYKITDESPYEKLVKQIEKDFDKVGIKLKDLKNLKNL